MSKRKPPQDIEEIRAFLTLTGLARHLSSSTEESQNGPFREALDRAKVYFPEERTDTIIQRAKVAEEIRNLGCVEAALRVPGDKEIVNFESGNGKWMDVKLECGHTVRVQQTNGSQPKKAPCRKCHKRFLKQKKRDL